MPIINSIINWLNIKRLSQIELFKKYPFEVQKETLMRNLMLAKDTVWGKKYKFNEIKDINEYQQRLPVVQYEDIKPLIDRLMAGEKDLLWPDVVRWFAKSSGTTADKSKFIPVSRESLEDNHYRGGRDTLVIYTKNYPDTGIFSGKGLTLGGSHQAVPFNNQTLYGDLSAILIEQLPLWADLIRTPRQKIALMNDWEKKLDEITRTTITENVTNIAGVPSWNLVLIKHILAYTGKRNLLEIWPNLELFTHGGVSFGPYREQFEKLIPSKKMHYMETYNASEGFFAIQDDPLTNDMLLLLDSGIFYEFIPITNERETGPCISIGEVKTNVNYAMVISTNAGLWRYKIGDTVMFTSLYPHKIRITGRTKHYINVFGEELIIDNVENALSKACKLSNSVVSEYTVAPVYIETNKKGCHEWIIEFQNPPENIEYFTNVLDHALMSLNSDYEAKRFKNITLGPPLLTIVKSGTFYNWLKDKGKLGGQNKIPRLSNDRRYADELLKK